MNTTATLSYLRVAPLSVVLSARFFQMAAMPVAVVSDLNAEIINLKPLEQKELEKRGGARQQVRTLFPLRRCPSRLPSLSVTPQMTIDADTSHSRKKKKKLEKYIVCDVPESSHLSLSSISGKEIETGGARQHSC